MTFRINILRQEDYDNYELDSYEEVLEYFPKLKSVVVKKNWSGFSAPFFEVKTLNDLEILFKITSDITIKNREKIITLIKYC